MASSDHHRCRLTITTAISSGSRKIACNLNPKASPNQADAASALRSISASTAARQHAAYSESHCPQTPLFITTVGSRNTAPNAATGVLNDCGRSRATMAAPTPASARSPRIEIAFTATIG